MVGATTPKFLCINISALFGRSAHCTVYFACSDVFCSHVHNSSGHASLATFLILLVAITVTPWMFVYLFSCLGGCLELLHSPCWPWALNLQPPFPRAETVSTYHMSQTPSSYSSVVSIFVNKSCSGIISSNTILGFQKRTLSLDLISLGPLSNIPSKLVDDVSSVPSCGL